MRTIPLQHLADVRTGYSVRGSLEPGSVGYVRAGDLTERLYLTPDDVEATTDAEPDERHWLRSGDVVMASVGSVNRAAFVSGDGRRCVASTSLLVARPGDALDPTFLAWYLNSDPAQAFFASKMQFASTIARLRVGDLADLPLPDVPIALQQSIGRAAMLAADEAVLSRRLADRRLAQVDALLLDTTLNHVR